MPKYWFLDLALIILSFAPIFFFKNTLFDRIYLSIIFVFIGAFLCINVHIYKFMHFVFSLKDLALMLSNVRQLAMRGGQLIYANIIINLLLMGCFISWIIVFNSKLNFKETNKIKNPPLKKVVLIGSLLTASSLINYEMMMGICVTLELKQNVTSVRCPNFNANYHFKKFGMINYYIREARQLIFNKHYSSDQEVIDYLSSSQKTNDQYTGLLEGKNPNIFCIMLETGDQLIVNPYTMPNLYDFLYNRGIYCKHNYSINHSNTSNDIGVMGSYPSGYLYQSKNYNLPFSLPNILNNKNYNTRFYYDILEEEDDYYDLQFMKKVGFQNVFDHYGFASELEPGRYSTMHNPDSAVSEQIIKNLKESKLEQQNIPFYTQWMTLYMHMDNSVNNGNKKGVEKLVEKYGEQLNKLEQEKKWTNVCNNEQSKIIYYIYTLKTMDFDLALGKLLNYFYGPDSSDYLKNTIFIIFGDHYWYELGNDIVMSKQIKNIYDEENINLYSTILGFYHPDIMTKVVADSSGLFNGHVINKMTSIASIVPTVLDLLNIPFNTKIYQDHSLFDLYGEQKFNPNLHEILYSNWMTLYMDEHYTSDNGGFISNIIDDNNQKQWFINKVLEKELQLKILNTIYKKNFFDRYDYGKFI